MTEEEGALRSVLRRIGVRRHRPVRQGIQAARTALGFVLYRSGALRLWRRRPRSSPIILMYHSVGGRGLSPEIVISAEHFEAHVRHLQRHYRVTSLDDVVWRLGTGRPAPADAVTVTLDDGYRDNYENAFPILRRYGCPATVFVTVEPVQTGRTPWPQLVWRWLQATRRPALHVVWRSANGAAIDQVLPLGTATERAQARSVLRMFAGGLEARERDDLLQVIAGALGCSVEPAGGDSMLTWDQLREMSRAGITIGGHTMTHPRLSGLDAEAVRHELVESRKILGRELEADVRFFAYPFGGPKFFNEDTKRAVAEAGYVAACSGIVGPRNAAVDLRALDRLYVRDEPVWKFALRLAQLGTGSRLIAWTLRIDT